jgi:HK97 family phage portal protein
VVSPEFATAAFGGSSTSVSGETVTLEKALSLAALWQVVTKIATGIAAIPIEVYKRRGEKKKLDRDSPTSRLLRKQFGPDLSSYDGRVYLNLWALLGNGYLYIERDGHGEPVELLPIQCVVELENGRPVYYTTDTNTGARKQLNRDDVIHCKGPTWDGFTGADVIRYARDVLGLYLSAQKYTGRFFKNGAQSGGVFEIPKMQQDAQKRLMASLEDKYANPDSWFKAIFLLDGTKFTGTSFNPQQAQLLEQKNAFAVDICRFFNMNPAMIGVEGYASYNSLYEAKEQYLDDCLSPRLIAEKVAFEAKLLPREEWLDDKCFIEHNTKSLLRMSPKDEQQVLAGYTAARIMTTNEARARLNLEPIEGGDELIDPAKANNSGGGNKTPVDPNNPKEPGDDTLATQGKPPNPDRAALILGMLNHARSKAGKPGAFRTLVTGGMKSHRETAEKAGFLDDFEGLLSDLTTVLDGFTAEKFEIIAANWKEKAL